MKVIFGTTNERKVEDLQNLCNKNNINLEIISMSDIEWDRGEIDENGKTIEENSLIKAKAIYSFCKERGINYPIITDDAGLFVEALNNRPGIYTARYADDEIALDPTLPKYQCVIKLLKELNGSENRSAYYKAVVTCMMSDGTFFQEDGISKGYIAKDIIGALKKPYFYSVFILDGYEKAFSDLTNEELDNTYRYQALSKVLKKI